MARTDDEQNLCLFAGAKLNLSPKHRDRIEHASIMPRELRPQVHPARRVVRASASEELRA